MQLGAQHEILCTCSTLLLWSLATKTSMYALPKPTCNNGSSMVLRDGTPKGHFSCVIYLTYVSFTILNLFISAIYK